MAIHHAQIKKAEKMGVQLSEDGDAVIAFWPKRALKITGASAGDAMMQMQAAQALLNDDSLRVRPDESEPRLVAVIRADDGFVLKGSPMPPVAAHKIVVLKREGEFIDPTPFTAALSAGEQAEIDALNAESGDAPEHGAKSDIERINGIATDGAVAFKEGTPAGDCPYNSDDEDAYEDFERWNEEWDAAADEATEEDGEKGGTVVAEKYRAKYAEAGHPTHCGDWLAETLNEICLNKGGTNLELFEEICGLNGVDTSKYKRSGVGWQGRIRMTGRNLVAKKVFQRGGILILPETINGGTMQAPGEWMEQQRYKRPAKAEPTGDVIAIKSA